MSRRTRNREYVANRDSCRSGHGSGFLLPGRRAQHHASSPRHRSKIPHTQSSLAQFEESGGVPLKFNRDVYTSSLSSYNRARPLATSPTKANPNERISHPVFVERQYKLGTTTSNTIYTKPPPNQNSKPPFTLGAQQQNVSPKAKRIVKVSFAPALNQHVVPVDPLTAPSFAMDHNYNAPNYNMTDTTTAATTTIATSPLSTTYVRQDSDCWPTLKKPTSGLQSGLHQNSLGIHNQHLTTKDFKGQLNTEVLTGGYGHDAYHGVGGSRTIMSSIPIPAHQEDFQWPTSSKWELERSEASGGLPCLFDFSAEHMKTFRGGKSKFHQMANGGGIGHAPVRTIDYRGYGAGNSSEASRTSSHRS